MPNVFCERCDTNKCRVTCDECLKFTCGDCRLPHRDGYICRFCFSRRIRPVRVTEITLSRRDMIWGDRVRRALNDVYEQAGCPIGLHLFSIVAMIYTIPTTNLTEGVLRDQYVRIGKHFYHARFILTERMMRREQPLVRPMFLSDEQKESIAAAATHPERLEHWLSKGWDAEWDHVFG